MTLPYPEPAALLDDAAKHPGYFFADVFRKTSERFACEAWPFPPGNTVTLARLVHLLAFRPVAKRHSSMPAGEVVVAPHEARYLAYLDAALTLNDAIDRAAKAGALRLRDRSTSLPVPDWHLPTWDRRDFLKRAILEGDNRRAIDFVVSSDWLIVPYPHFAPSLTVSLPEFSAWAVGEGLADAGEIERLLAEQPKEIPGLAGAVNAFFGGPAVDLEAGLYPNRTGLEAEQQAGPVIADQGAPASDTNEPPQEWQRGIRRVAWDAAAVIVERGDRLTPDGLEKQMLDSGKVELKEDEYHLKSSGSGLTEREMKAKPATIAGWVTAIKKQKLLKP